MDPLSADALAVDEARAFNFFSENLADVLGPDRRAVPRDEFLHVTSVLAHYTLVGQGSVGHLPLPATLRQIFDLYVLDATTWEDAELLETAAAQTLVMTGFFAQGMRRRHHLDTYVDWGRAFYGRAAVATGGRKQQLLSGMSRHFPTWRTHLERLHDQLREQQLLLGLVSGPHGNEPPRLM